MKKNTYTLNTANYLFVKADNLNNPSTTVSFNYTVTPLNINNESIKVGDLVDKEYTGSTIAPEIALYLNNFNIRIGCFNFIYCISFIQHKN